MQDRHRLGDWLTLSVRTTDAVGTPTLPTDAPTAAIYSASTRVETVSLPIADRYKVTAFFKRHIQLDSDYSAGYYQVVYDWNISGGYHGTKVEHFQVVAGGDADGAVISVEKLERPEAQYLLYKVDSGAILAGRNPS